MKLSVVVFMMMVQLSWSQAEQHRFSLSELKLEKFLNKIEQKFDIKYSYADSIVFPQEINLPAGNYTLLQLHEEIERQTDLKVVQVNSRYYSVCPKLEEPIKTEHLDETLVAGFISKGISKSDQKIIISPQEVEELPGVTDADIMLSLQQLLGVKSPNETATGLHVRGGTSDQNLILWDGIRMYHPGHLFGMISGFNPNIKQTVHFYNKAADPKFGERISSMIDIRTTDEIPSQLKVDAGLNALDADVYVRVPIVKGKVGLQLAGRKSLTEWFRTPTFNSLADKVFQNTDLTDFDDENRFGFHDYSAKLNYALNNRNSFSVTAIAIDNHLDFESIGIKPQPKTQKMDIRNFGSSLNWNHHYNTKLSHKILLHYSAYTFDYEKTQQYPIEGSDTFTKRNRITDSGAELSFNYEWTNHFKADFGYQLSGNDISHSYVNESPGIVVELDQKHLFNLTHVGYSNIKYVIDNWKFNGGFRYNYYVHLNKYSFEPRIFIERNVLKDFVWQLTYERKSQIASQVRESVANDLSLENYVWVLSGDGEYPIQKAHQYSSGFIYKTKPFVVDVDLYYKTMSGITSMTFGFLHQYDSSLHFGQGFTKGIDVLVQKNAPTWRAWITYTYQDSQNKYEGLNDNRYFPINSDTRHSLSLSYYKKWGNYSLSTGWFLHSGRPYSELNGSSEISSFNDRRLPTYHRLNISATYQFQQGDSWKGKVGFSLFNVYGKRTPISKEYERQYSDIEDIIGSGYIVQDYYSLGFTPNVFCRIRF
ncbi:MAG TPA: TonB-dependent receptor [Flavobacterium sp.]|jgi:hypothetical protein